MPVAVLRDSHQRLINEYFQQNPYWAFNHDELSEFIAQNRPAWGLPKSWSKQHISDILLDGGWLHRVSLTSDLYGPKTRFASRLASTFQIGLSIRKGSYLSHGTAASLHSLTDTDLSITYINKEQSPKTSNRTLSQDAIDRAFQRSPRESNYRFWHMDPAPPTQYVLLNGKASGDFGVESVEHPEILKERWSNSPFVLSTRAVLPQFSRHMSKLESVSTYLGWRAHSNSWTTRIPTTSRSAF